MAEVLAPLLLHNDATQSNKLVTPCEKRIQAYKLPNEDNRCPQRKLSTFTRLVRVYLQCLTRRSHVLRVEGRQFNVELVVHVLTKACISHAASGSGSSGRKHSNRHASGRWEGGGHTQGASGRGDAAAGVAARQLRRADAQALLKRLTKLRFLLQAALHACFRSFGNFILRDVVEAHI